MLTLSDVAEALVGVALQPEWAGRAITDTVVDSRSATQGSLFVALAGDRTDGHLYLNAAFEAGAIAAIAEERALQSCENAASLWPDGTLRLPGPEAKGSPHTLVQPLIFVVPASNGSRRSGARSCRS